MSSRNWIVPVIVLSGLVHLAHAGDTPPTLLDARKGHTTKLMQVWREGWVPEIPPKGVLELTRYYGPLGPMAAYVSPNPGDRKRHPAIIWLVGGRSNSISSVAWEPAPRDNDQSARGFRSRGIIMMYPSLRGGNKSPGAKERFYGEVDDVLAAAMHLARLPYVDPKRIYLGGHSTGGTLALLVAETGTTRFRAVFSLGPIQSVSSYGQDSVPFDINDEKEVRLRSPINWLAGVVCPTFVFEGVGPENSNMASLISLNRANSNPRVHFHPVPRADHFTLIAPWVDNAAAQIVADTGESASFDFSNVDKLMPSGAAKKY